MAELKLDDALRELTEAVAAGTTMRGRDARFRAARQVLVSHIVGTLGIEGTPSVGAVIKLAADVPARQAQRACAVMVVHALAIRGLLPPASLADVCTLVERALRDVLLRCDYPFGGSLDAKMQALERLHVRLDELMQPLEPTFPNWQGLYAG